MLFKIDVCVFSIDHSSNYSSNAGEESYNEPENVQHAINKKL